MPFITAFLSIFICRRSINSYRLFVYLLGIVGTVWVVFNGSIESLLSFSLNQGDLIFMAGVIFLGLYSISTKLLYRNDDMIVLVFSTLVGGSLWMGLALLVLGQPFQINLVQGHLIFPMIYLVLGATLASVFLYQKTTIALGPSRVTAFIYLNPASVAILLFLINGVPISLSVLPGILISTVATFILQKDNKEDRVQIC
jgi:drug/metabolite transporter (DMT)-like permease